MFYFFPWNDDEAPYLNKKMIMFHISIYTSKKLSRYYQDTIKILSRYYNVFPMISKNLWTPPKKNARKTLKKRIQDFSSWRSTSRARQASACQRATSQHRGPQGSPSLHQSRSTGHRDHQWYLSWGQLIIGEYRWTSLDILGRDPKNYIYILFTYIYIYTLFTYIYIYCIIYIYIYIIYITYIYIYYIYIYIYITYI